MSEALAACKSLFTRFDTGEALIALRDVAVIVLALERHYVDDDVRAIVRQLAVHPGGALDLVGLCEVVSYVMKGVPHTNDALTLESPAGESVLVSLADVASANLKALYTMHPAFDEQRCWLHTETALAEHCVIEGDNLEYACTHQPATFTVRAMDWVHRQCPAGGDAVEVRLRGPVNMVAEVSDRNDGSYLVSFNPTISGAYTVHVTVNRTPVRGSPFNLVVDSDVTRPEDCVAEGSGLIGAEAGRASTFTILKRDRLGKPRTRGVDHFYADVQGPGKWECQI